MSFKLDLEFDTSAEEMVAFSIPNKTQASIFGLSLDQTNALTNQNAAISKYHEQLSNEIDEWNKLMKNTFNIMRDLKQKDSKNYSLDILLKEDREYLEKAPNLNAFIQSSNEFNDRAQQFLQVQLPELIAAQDELMEVCKERKAHIATQVAEKLFNDVAVDAEDLI